LTAPARGARPAVDELPPSVLRVGADSEGIDVEILERDRLAVVADSERAHLSLRLDVVEEHVWHSHHQVHVLGQWYEHEENAD